MRVSAFLPFVLLLAQPAVAQTPDDVLPTPKVVVIGRVVVEEPVGPGYVSLLSELPKKFGEKKEEKKERTGVRRLFVRVHRAVEGFASAELIEVLWEYKYTSSDDIPGMLLRVRPWPMGSAPPEVTIQKPVLRLWKLALLSASNDPRCSTRQGGTFHSPTRNDSVPCYLLVPNGLESVTDLKQETTARLSAS